MHADCYPNGNKAKARAKFEKWYKPFRDFRAIVDRGGDLGAISNRENQGTAMKILAGIGATGNIMYKGLKFGMGLYQGKSVPHADVVRVHRAMFKTEQGFVGISSRHVKVGDAVALVEGGRMPLMVREDKRGMWSLVGDAYVHGLMEGLRLERGRCGMMSFC